MNNIQLCTIETTGNGSRHVQLLIDGSDCGILYLSESEYEIMERVLQKGTEVDLDTDFSAM